MTEESFFYKEIISRARATSDGSHPGAQGIEQGIISAWNSAWCLAHFGSC